MMVFLSTDGPHRNVLKFKPPMCFSKENVDELVEKVEVVLKEIEEDPEAPSTHTNGSSSQNGKSNGVKDQKDGPSPKKLKT